MPTSPESRISTAVLTKGFILHQLAAHIRDSSYEGAKPRDTLNYVINLLEESAAESSFENLQKYIAIFQYMLQFDQWMAEKAYDKILAHMKARCKSQGVCYLPSGWVTKSGGHFAVLKCLQLENGNYALSVLNQGDGSRYHLLLEQGKLKSKYDYESAQYEHELSLSFIENLAQFTHPDKKPDNDFSASDLYALLIGLALRRLPSKMRHGHAVTAQRSGTCAVNSALLVIRDLTLYESPQADERMMRRYHFLLKHVSLHLGVKLLEEGHLEPHLFQLALDEYYTRIAKYYPDVLTEAEMREKTVFAHGLQSTVDDKRSSKQRTRDKRCLPPLSHPMTQNSTKIALNVTSPSYSNKSHPKLEDRVKIMPDLTLPINQLDNADIAVTIIDHLRAIAILKGPTAAVTACDFLHCLPPPSGDEHDAFWDRVPETECENLVIEFSKLISDMDNFITKNKFIYTAAHEVRLMAYDIMAQLAPRIQALGLGDTYTFALANVYQYLMFKDASAFKTVTQVYRHFQARASRRTALFSVLMIYDKAQVPPEFNYLNELMRGSDGYQKLVSDMQQGKAVELENGSLSPENLFLVLMKRSYRSQEPHGNVVDSKLNLQRYLPPALIAMIKCAQFVHLARSNYEFNAKYDDNIFYSGSRIYNILAMLHSQKDFGDAGGFWSSRDRFKMLREVAGLPIKQPGFQDGSENTLYLDEAIGESRLGGTSVSDRSSFGMIDFLRALPVSINTDSLYPDQPFDVDLKSIQDEQVLQQLKYLDATPSFSAVNALIFAIDNLDSLHIKALRDRLSWHILRMNHLPAALAQSGQETLDLCRALIVQGLQFEGDLETWLWICELAASLQNHVQYLMPPDHPLMRDLTWPDVLAELEQKIDSATLPGLKAKYAACAILLMDALNPEQALFLLRCQMLTEVHGHPDDETAQAPLRIWKRHRHLVFDVLSKMTKDSTNSHLNQLASEVLGTTELLNLDWQVDKNLMMLVSNQDISIEFDCGMVLSSGLDARNYREDIVSSLQVTLNLDAKQVWMKIEVIGRNPTDKAYQTPDGCYTIHTDYNNTIEGIKRLITINGQLIEFTLLYGHQNDTAIVIYNKFNALNISNPFEDLIEKFHSSNDEHRKFRASQLSNLYEDSEDKLTEKHESPDYLYWQHGRHIFVETVGHAEQAYIHVSGLGFEKLHQSSINDYLREERYLMPLEGEQLSPLAKEWKSYWSEKKLLVGCLMFVAYHNQEQSVDRIEHHSLGLAFTKREGHLYCDELPDFWLSKSFSHKALNGLSLFILLENSHGEQRMILPIRDVDKQSKSTVFQTEPLFKNSGSGIGSFTKPYVTCHLNALGEAEGDTPEADAWLAMIFRSQGDYLNALRCLNRTWIHRNNSQAMLDVFSIAHKNPNHEAAACAFDCHLVLRLMAHCEKWTLSLNEWRHQKDDPFILMLDKQFSQYAQCMSEFRTAVHVIPAKLRLSEEDRIKIFVKVKSLPPLTSLVMRFFDKLEGHDFLINCRLQDICSGDFDFTIKTLPPKTFLEAKRAQGAWPLRVRQSESSEIFLNHWFIPLFEALTQTDNRQSQRQARMVLYYLLQQELGGVPDSTATLVAALAYVANNPKKMTAIRKTLKGESTNESVYQALLKIATADKNRQALSILDTHGPALLTTVIPSKATHDIAVSPVDFKLRPIEANQFVLNSQKAMTVCFDVREDALVGEGPLFTREVSRKASLLEGQMIEHYEQGHRDNQGKKRAIYTLNATDTLKHHLETLYMDYKKQWSERALALIDRANDIKADTADAVLFKIRRQSGQIDPIQLGDILNALLTHQFGPIKKANPWLSDDEVTALMADACDLLLLASGQTQIEQAIEILSTPLNALSIHQVQQLGQQVFKTRAYKVEQFPEFLIYEYLTKTLLRPEQIEVLTRIIDIIEGRSRDDFQQALLQFAAGGGKTAVLIPLLAHRIARTGFLPVIINTSELYQIGLDEIAISLRQAFNQMLEVIEYELEHTWQPEELIKLLKDLEHWRATGRCVLLKAVTWHSLNICFQSACLKKERDLSKAAHAVLEFFREKSISLIDEAHLTLDPLQQSIMTAGQMQALPLEQLALVSRFYDYILGYEGNPEIATLSGRMSAVFELLSEADTIKLQGQLVEVMCEDALFKSVDKDLLRAYWRQDSDERPKWLSVHPTEDLIILARGFLHNLLPYILTLKRGKDFGYSLHKNDDTAAPQHDGTPILAHLSDPILVVALSTELYAYDGVSDSLLTRLIHAQKHIHQRQREWQPKGQTEVEQLFQRNLPADAPLINFDKPIKLLLGYLLGQPSLRKQAEIVRLCLKRFVYPQIKVPEYSLVSTPAALQYGFKRSVLFTATPMDIRIYPWQLKACNSILSPAFEAQVIWQMLQDKNSRHCLLPKTADPVTFFRALREASPDIFTDMTDLIDRGALLSNSTNEAVVRAFLDEYEATKATREASGLYFDQQMKMVGKTPGLNDLIITGTRFAEALKRRGIKPETMLLFLFLDLTKTTGTDVKRPASDRAALTLGFQSMTETIQAVMRKRLFLDPNGQQIMQVMFINLYSQVYREMMQAEPDHLVFDFQIVARWFIANEAERLPVRITLAAWQGLAEIYRQRLWEEIYQGKKKIDKYLDIGILKQDYSLKAKDNYAIPRTLCETASVLNAYVAHLSDVCDITFAKESQEAIAIQAIIERTSKAVAEIQSPQSQNLGNEAMQQEQSTQLTMEENQQQERNRALKRVNQGTENRPMNRELYSPDLTITRALTDNTYAKPLKLGKLPACTAIDFRLNADDFSPFTLNRRQKDTIVFLKPINALLMEKRADGTMACLALTTAGQEYFNHQMTYASDDKAYAIISHLGHVLACTSAWALKNQAQVLEDKHCQKFLAFTQFLRGEMPNLMHLAEVIKTLQWTQAQFKEALLAISSARVDSVSMTFPDEFPVLEQCCGWVDHKIVLSGQVILPPTPVYPKKLMSLSENNDLWLQPVRLIQPPQSPAFSFFNGKPISFEPDWVLAPQSQMLNVRQIMRVIEQLTRMRRQIVPTDNIGFGATFSGTAARAYNIDALISILSQAPHQYAHLDIQQLLRQPFTVSRKGAWLGALRPHENIICIQDVLGPGENISLEPDDKRTRP